MISKPQHQFSPLAMLILGVLRNFVFVCTMFVFLTLSLTRNTWAQGGDDQAWTTPISLYEMPTDSYAPAIVADPSGKVHVFWGESLEPESVVGNMIMYTYWDGETWSVPNDILISPEGIEARSWYPAPAVDADGQIHLVWIGGFAGTTAYYSSARADEAMSAAAWSDPVRLEPGGSSAHIVIDEIGNIHVVLTIPTGLDQGIYYLRSEDRGKTWLEPELIPDSRLDPEVFLYNARLAVGGDGTIHVAWWWSTAEFPPDGVMYIRSIDGGKTWTDLLSMEGPLQELDVATVGEREVHLVWSSTVPERYKWYRRSDDGGQNWTPIEKWSKLGGFHGWTGMAVDSDNILHLGIVSNHPQIPAKRNEALLHMQWDGQRWSEAEIVLANAPIEGENQKNAAIAISEGNLVHLVVQYPLAANQKRPYQYDIYYSQRRVNSSYVPPKPIPTVTPLPSPTMTPTTEPTVTPTRPRTSGTIPYSHTSATEGTSAAPGFPIFVAAGPVLIILAGIILVWIGDYKRRT